MTDKVKGVQVLVDLDADFAAAQSALENCRRVASWAKDYLEAVAGLGFAARVDLDGSDLLIRVGAVAEGVSAPRAAPDFEVVDTGPAPAAVAETPAQEAVQPPEKRADGGGELRGRGGDAPGVVAAPVEANVDQFAHWSAAEDEALVQDTARGIVKGLSRTAAARAAAPKGRTARAAEQRVVGKLKDRLAAAITALPARPAAVAPAARAVVPAPVPVVAAAAAPVPAALPGWQRELAGHLDRIGNAAPFTPVVDLAIFEAQARGQRVPAIADGLGLEAAAVRARVLRLLPEPGIAAQQNLLTELRRRVAMGAEVAA